MPEKDKECDAEKLDKMFEGEEIVLKSRISNTVLVVRRVRGGWLYTYLREVWDGGQFISNVMTTTFVSL